MAIVPTNRQRVGPPSGSGGLATYPVGQGYKAAGQVFHETADFLGKIARAEDLGNLADSIRTSRDTITDTLAKIELEPDPEKRSFMFQEGIDKARQTRPDEYFMGKEWDQQFDTLEPSWHYWFTSLDANMRVREVKGKVEELYGSALIAPNAAEAEAGCDLAIDTGLKSGVYDRVEAEKKRKDFPAARSLALADRKYAELSRNLSLYLSSGLPSPEFVAGLEQYAKEAQEAINGLTGLNEKQEDTRQRLSSQFDHFGEEIRRQEKAVFATNESRMFAQFYVNLARPDFDPAMIDQAVSLGRLTVDHAQSLKTWRRLNQSQIETDLPTYWKNKQKITTLIQSGQPANTVANETIDDACKGKLSPSDAKTLLNDLDNTTVKANAAWQKKFMEGVANAYFVSEADWAIARKREPGLTFEEFQAREPNLGAVAKALDDLATYKAQSGTPLVGTDLYDAGVSFLGEYIKDHPPGPSIDQIATGIGRTTWDKLTADERKDIVLYLRGPKGRSDPEAYATIRRMIRKAQLERTPNAK